MASAVSSVIVAAAQSVGKVYLIGGIGWIATRFPSERPFLPVALVPVIARFSFHVLVLSLIVSTTAKSVNIDTIGNYWSLIVGAFLVVAISWMSASALACVLLRSKTIRDHVDVGALNVAATFPNIVALPILIFPTLCEFEAVHKGYASADQRADGTTATDLVDTCVAESNTVSYTVKCRNVLNPINKMIFCYFFSWSLAFWTFGYPKLLASANAFSQKNERDEEDPTEESGEFVSDTRSVNSILSRTAQLGSYLIAGQNISSIWAFGYPQILATTQHHVSQSRAKGTNNEPRPPGLFQALRTTVSSPGFIALVVGMAIGCTPTLPDLLFVPGGWLRWLGDGLETLGSASSPLATMIVAASLAPKRKAREEEVSLDSNEDEESSEAAVPWLKRLIRNIVSDQTAVLFWFSLSRLIVAPAIVVTILIFLRCQLADFVSPLAMLVLIINSCLPGALIVVVLLQSSPNLADTAATVAKVYLPSYLVSIVTIAAWTALGLWVTLPDPDTGVQPACNR